MIDIRRAPHLAGERVRKSDERLSKVRTAQERRSYALGPALGQPGERHFMRVLRAALLLTLVGPSHVLAQANTTTEAVVYNGFSPSGLQGPNTLIRGSDGDFYGTTSAALFGAVFKITPSGTLITLHAFTGNDGVGPSLLVQGSDGNFYGTTIPAPSYNPPVPHSSVFQMTPSGTVTTLHWFTGGPDGEFGFPCGGLSVGSDGALYGATQGGGANNMGTVFRIATTGSLTTLYSFGGPDGSAPCGPPVQGSDGNFYGTTMTGGAQNSGTVYKITGSGALTSLHSFFNTTDGIEPFGALVQGSDGNFYGTTRVGTFFRVTPTGTFIELANVINSNGYRPAVSWLMQGTDGNFYTTTFYGGAYNHGAVIQLTPSGGMTTLYSFNPGTNGTADGLGPDGPPAQGDNGTLYGVTFQGGSSKAGIVYALGVEPGLINSFFLVAPNVAPPEGPCDGSATASGCAQTPEPINPATGNEGVIEPDDYRSGDGRLRFTRTYNSIAAGTATPLYLGPGWQDNFAGRHLAWTNHVSPTLPRYSVSKSYGTPASACQQGWADVALGQPNSAGVTATYSGGACQLSSGQSWPVFSPGTNSTGSGASIGVAAERPAGSTFLFSCQSTTCTGNPSVALSLAPASGGYSLTDENDTIEHYDSNGLLQSLTYRGGYSQTLSYSNGFLSSVVDSFGRSLSFNYSANNQLQSVTTPIGQVQYGYDGSGRLISVTYPDGGVRTYSYGNAQYRYALTGIADESGNTYASISYDTQGRANQSSLAGSAWASAVDYTNVASPVVTDSFGVARTYQYGTISARSKLKAITGSPCNICGKAAASTYDSAGYPLSETDWNGNVTQHVYDDTRGLEVSRTEASGTPSARTVTTQWNAQYRVPAVQAIYAGSTGSGTALRTLSATYDTNGNQLTRTITDTTVTPNVSRTWTYTYDSFGQVLTVKGPRTDLNSTTTYSYYACLTGYQCGQLQTITDALGNVTTFNTYNANGQPLTITDSNGVVTTLTYDTRGRLVSRSTAGETTALAYYPTGLLKQVTLPDGSFLQYTYDGAHRVTQITDGFGNTIQFALDAMGNRTSEIAYDPSHVLSRTRSRVYSNLNRLYQEIGAAGTAAVTTTYGYDSNGNLTSINAPLSRNTSKTYDELNRPKVITDPGNGNTVIVYDANNNVTSVHDPLGLATNYTYNGFGDLQVEVSPATGTTTNTHDSAGNLKTTSDARGVGGTYGYDALNRVTQVAYGNQTITYTYDAGTNGKGRLTGASDGTHSMGWQYDALGRVTTKTQTLGGLTASVRYAYTNARLTTLRTPSGQAVAYSYTDNQVTSIAVNGTTLLSGVAYEPFGPARTWTWGNGRSETRLRDTDGNPSQFSGAESASYTVDSAFRIVGITNASNGALSWSYGYDTLDRLTGASTSSATLTWTYNANGDRLSQAGAAGPAYAAKNIIPAYNNRGRLSGLTGGGGAASYLYNAVGQRIAKTTFGGQTIFVYDEVGHLLGEYDGNGNLIEETVWMGDLSVATLRPNGSGGIGVYYIHADHLGTPTSVTRSTDNAIVWRWDRDPFGTAAANQNPGALGAFVYNLRLPGQYFDAETGLSYNYFRDYDSQVGRYAQGDPIGVMGGVNRYLYANGDPINNLDPLGLWCLSDRAINAITGAVSGAITEGAAFFAEAGLWGAVFGVVVGATTGAEFGFASKPTLTQRALAGAFQDPVLTPNSMLGGAAGEVITAGAEKAGAPDWLSGTAGQSAGGLIASGKAGAASGAAGGAVAAAVGAAIRAGNDCPLCAK